MPRNKLLLIEDDRDYRLILRHMIGRIYDIVEAGTLAAGLSMLSFANAHCLLLDLNLPDSSPDYTVQLARAQRLEVPIVAVSYDSRPETIATAIHAGADGFLVKGRDDLRAGEIVKAISQAVVQRGILNSLDRIRGETQFLCREAAIA